MKRGRRNLSKSFTKTIADRLHAAAKSFGVEVGVVIKFIHKKRGLSLKTIKFHFNGKVCPDVQSLAWYSEDLGVPTDFLLGLDDGNAANIVRIARKIAKDESSEHARELQRYVTKPE